ncbi:M23 family metallopeptidase [Candidatus Deferrimicrobium sp.]|uniref:M23 family metallopeptidase n=1 Tax=Candidatus Deferrimicrobium sp. TaxID=3060586 RepID=UPI002ED695EB
MSGDHLFTFRVGYAGRSLEIRVGRTAAMVAASVLGVLFVLLTQGIYDIRDNISKLHELRALRERVSEQNLSLYHLDAKFEGLSAEVERLRAMDNRIRSLVMANDSLRKNSSRGVGGAETPEVSAANRLDKLLDLKFDRMKKELLVDVNDLDVLGETLDSRRLLLESVPGGWPVRGILSSVFGVRISPFTQTPVFHHGLDIVAQTGAPVLASASGVVVKSGYEAQYGNVVVVDHGAGYRSVYAHMSSSSVEEGAFVNRGEEVGKVGSTGRSTGPHLHYEVRVNGLPVNPARFLN